MNFTFLIVVLGAVALVIGVAAFSNFELDNRHYDRLKWLIIRWSYITTFLGLITTTFKIPYGVEIVTVVAGIGTLIAGLMGVSTNNWKVDQPQITFNEDEFEDMVEDAYEDTDKDTK